MAIEGIREIKAELRKPLNKAHVKPPAPGKYGDYLEAHHVISEGNRIFGEDGWTYRVHGIQMTNASQQGDKHRVGYMALCTVSALGVEKTDVGHGQGFGKSEGDCHDSAVKEAATDSLKRALRTFGNPFGLALYDKTQANVVDPAQVAVREKSATEYTADVVSRLQQCSELDAAVILQTEQSKIGRIRTGYPELFKRIEVAAKNAGAEMRETA